MTIPGRRASLMLPLMLAACPSITSATNPVYVGASYGLYRSTDAGATWSMVNIPLNNPLLNGPVAVTAIKIDPHNPSKIYCLGTATARAFFATADAGATWSATPFVGMYGRDLDVDFAGKVIYITATASVTSGDRLLYKSTNAGATWTRLLVPSTAVPPATTGSPVHYFAADAAVSGTVYAVTYLNEFFKSTDFGENWTKVANQITLTNRTIVPGTLNLSIHQDPLHPQVWYNATDHSSFPETCPVTNGGMCGLFKSTDGGATFTGLSLPSGYVSGVAIGAPSGTVYAAAEVGGLGGTVMKTTNGGDTWTAIKTGLFTPQSGKVWADAIDPDIVFVNDSLATRSFYVSTDAGASFKQSVIPQGPPGCVPGNCSGQEVNDVVIAPNLTSGLANVSGASFATIPLAPDSIASAFESHLATGDANASTIPLPTNLLGTTVKVRDSAGVERLAPLFFVSPGQVNYLIPQGTALGASTVTIAAGDGTSTQGSLQIASVSPGIFQFNSQGLAAALVIRVKPGNVQSTENVFRIENSAAVPLPINFGPEADQLVLELFATGVRHNTGLANVKVTIGGTEVPVQYAGEAPGFVGLDQINVGPLPRNLAGRGKVDITVSVDGHAAVVTNVTFQ